MSHSPEPWMVDRRTIYTMKDGQEDRVIAQVKGTDGEATANGAHIAACVNGCAGLTPLTPEGQSVYRECVEALKAIAQILHTPLSTWHHNSDVGPMDALCSLQDQIEQALAHARGAVMKDDDVNIGIGRER